MQLYVLIRDTPEIMPKESWKTKRGRAGIRAHCKGELIPSKPDFLRTKALTSLRKSLFNDKVQRTQNN